MSATRWVILATLIRPQGRHGELLAEILTDFPERFAERKRVFLLKNGSEEPIREAALDEHWMHKGRVVLKFAGVDSINDADMLRGLDVAVPLEERAPLDEDSVYIADLIGCRLFDVAREPRDAGEVIDVDREISGTPLLVVRSSASKEELLVPFAKAWLRLVDVPNKRIEMTLPQGLFEINAPLRTDERPE